MGKILKRTADERREVSLDELRAWLYATIEAETKKDEAEIDYELIKECSDLDAYLTGSDAPMSEEEYIRALRQIQSRVAVSREVLVDTGTPTRRKKRWSFRVAVVAAAIVMVMLSTTAVFAISRALSFPEAFSRKYQYTSVQEAADELELDISYPTTMPEGLEIEKVVLSYSGNIDIYEVIFVTNKPNEYRISVKTETVTEPKNWQDATAHSVNGIMFYVLKLSENEYLAVGQQNGFEYQISAANIDNLLIILGGMKKAT